ncbi:MAG: N-acetyltransferase [Betaproteobacteria bacterium]|nr:MAG: N-acetyltransferase [Betaproteobacteria bacterium]
MNLRPGAHQDIPVLDAIALEAKAHWGYSIEQLQAWREDLLIQSDLLIARPICVAEESGQLIGYAQVATDTLPWELCAVWVSPHCMGRGVGTALLAWAREFAATGKQHELAIDADPNAASFYVSCGARLVGTVAAPIASNPHRVRPQLVLSTSAV